MARGLVILGSETTPARQGTVSRSARAAVALAKLRLRNGFQAVTLCADAEACRYALGAGASQAIETPIDHLLEQTHDIALLGGDLRANQDLVAAQLAEQWRAVLVFDVLDFQREGDQWRIVRDGGRGAREIVWTAGPVVLVISSESPVSLYVSYHRRQSVRIDLTEMPSRSIVKADPAWEPAQPRARVGNLADKNRAAANDRMLNAFGISEGPTTPESASQMIQADPRTCAEHLLRYLAHHGFIDRRRISERLLKDNSPETLVNQSSQSAANRKAETVNSRSEIGLTSRVRRGPRFIDDKAAGQSRRPRPISQTEQRNFNNKVPEHIARRPRFVDSRPSRILRGPRPLA